MTKPLLLDGAMVFAIGTVCFADGLYWVVGNRVTNKCEIVEPGSRQENASKSRI